jgi:hypothetical protein
MPRQMPPDSGLAAAGHANEGEVQGQDLHPTIWAKHSSLAEVQIVTTGRSWSDSGQHRRPR